MNITFSAIVFVYCLKLKQTMNPFLNVYFAYPQKFDKKT